VPVGALDVHVGGQEHSKHLVHFPELEDHTIVQVTLLLQKDLNDGSGLIGLPHLLVIMDSVLLQYVHLPDLRADTGQGLGLLNHGGLPFLEEV